MSSWGFHEGEQIVPGRTVVDLLGSGLRYETYLAWDEHLRALVVAKVVLPGLVGDRDAMSGLAGEAALLERLAHPMLPRSFGARLDGDRPHLVLEHIEGPRLSTLIRRFGLILEQFLPLALNLCAALHYISREKVVHLDVKPSNVIMAGAPRLIDLSVARTFDQLGALTSPVGTDAYMSPEQCDPRRFGEIGPATDVWGLGATLYEALVRERPFPSDGRTGPPQGSWRTGSSLSWMPFRHRASGAFAPATGSWSAHSAANEGDLIRASRRSHRRARPSFEPDRRSFR
jgi:eukaryotic-like serine/threonine-protein kinase